MLWLIIFKIDEILKVSEAYVSTCPTIIESCEFINHFTTEVTLRKPLPVDSDIINNRDLNTDTAKGDPTDEEMQGPLSDCSQNWKAAMSDEHKKI